VAYAADGHSLTRQPNKLGYIEVTKNLVTSIYYDITIN
jgi:hypothetical protein